MSLPETLSLISFNIAHGRGIGVYQGFSSEAKIRANIQRISDYLVAEQADIVCLQEVDEDSHWNKRLNLLELLKESTGFPYALHGVHNRRHGERPLAYGNAILSRYPVHFWECNAFGEATLGEKGFLYAEVSIGGYALPIINLHLDFRSRKRRILQVEQIIDYMMSREAHEKASVLPPVICGDFNTHAGRAGDAVMHLFEHMQSHAGYHLYPKKARTFPAFFPARSLDFVLIPDSLEMIESRVGREILSDHCPVGVSFRIL